MDFRKSLAEKTKELQGKGPIEEHMCSLEHLFDWLEPSLFVHTARKRKKVALQEVKLNTIGATQYLSLIHI